MSMKTITPVLTAAAFVLFAGPAFAGHSTPQEREATRQLNIQAAQQAKSTNQQIAAASPNASTQTPTAPAAAPTTPVESAPPAGQIQDQPASPADPANPAAPAQQ
jgi:hypothetical protein